MHPPSNTSVPALAKANTILDPAGDWGAGGFEAMTIVTIDRDYLFATLADLIRINSINPSLVPGSAGEAAIAAYVADVLRKIGLSVTAHETQPGRVSVVGTLKGSGGGKSLYIQIPANGRPGTRIAVSKRSASHTRVQSITRIPLATAAASGPATCNG